MPGLGLGDWGKLNKEFYTFKTYFIFGPVFLLEFFLYNYSVKAAYYRVIYQEISKERVLNKQFAWLKGGWDPTSHRESIKKFVDKIKRKADNKEKLEQIMDHEGKKGKEWESVATIGNSEL